MSHCVMDDAREATVTEAHTDTINIQLADLLAILANELSQPLTAIGNYVNGARIILQRDQPDHERARNAMVMAAAQIARSAEHVALLRNLASDLHHAR
jgi:C4-dicarboxylate-specific signal transduction histidine kinase